MLTLLIADDEYFILERLKQIIDYQSLGYQLTDTAQNGRDAMRIIEEKAPDLAILDIKMPCLSGLDIAEQIYTNKWKTKVVILTSYDYFDFARQAISCQVFSYLLRPVNKADLTEILTDAAKLILDQKERDSKLLEYEQLQTELRLQRFLTASIPQAERKELSIQLPGIDAVRGICCLKFGSPDHTSLPPGPIRKALREIPNIPPYFDMEHQDNIICLLFKERRIPDSLPALIQRCLQEIFHTSVNIAFFNDIDCTGSLPSAYAKCLKGLQSTIFSGENTITHVSIEQLEEFSAPLHFDLKSQLVSALQKKDLSQTISLIHDAFFKLRQSPCTDNLEALILEILSAGKTASAPESISYTAHRLMDGHNCVETLEEWCCGYLSRSMESSASDKTDFNTTKMIMEMIQASYPDTKLDLPYIALKIGYTQNYISSIFKRNTGLTVVQYITQCRMNAAYLLLTAHHMPVNQVYGEVGYSNPFYFSKRFKQYFGYSPSECSKKS